MTLVDSGEPWLGMVPSDWIRTRIRNIVAMSPGYSVAAPLSTEAVTIVPMECVSETGLLDISKQQLFEDVQGGLTLFEPGDVIFAKITPCMENGKGAVVESLPTRFAFGSTEFHVLRTTHRADPWFLYYYTYNPVFRAFAAENMTGTAGQKRVTSRFLKDTRIFLPPIREQKRIAAFLSASCALVDAVSTTTARGAERPGDSGVLNRQMAALRGYRASLIHECVTGQRRITEADLNRVKAYAQKEVA